jgi:lipoprotein-anchoring transpeptidase ErfK/SrfK
MPAKEQRGQTYAIAERGRPAAYELPAPRRRLWVWLLPVLFLLAVVVGVLAGGLSFVYARERVFPGVTSLGVPLGGRTAAEAATNLQDRWNEQSIVLENSDRTWEVSPADLGMLLDTQATAGAAAAKGRSPADLRSILDEGAGWFAVPPVWTYDTGTARRTLVDLAPQLAVGPVDAGVIIRNGRAEATPTIEGRELDVEATLSAIAADPASVLVNGRLPLAVRQVPAALVDVSTAVNEANRLLATTVTLEAYDPVSDQLYSWTVEPEVWGEWLRLTVDLAATDSFGWALDRQIGAAYLDALEADLGDGRYLDEDATLAALSEAIQAQSGAAIARVRHPERRHIVQSGETLSSIGFDYGIPYPWIQQLNPGVEGLTVGQEIAIPAADALLPLPVVPHKRIVVSLSEQRTWVYENGQLKWEWPSSTGIQSSPTAPGIFQVQSHESNAYAGNWDLWMPSFMGIYRPVPTSDFMNGFHGFPTRGNSQLLWTGDLGHPVTYGCILLSSENAALLYDWAEEGVVVEVQP